MFAATFLARSVFGRSDTNGGGPSTESFEVSAADNATFAAPTDDDARVGLVKKYFAALFGHPAAELALAGGRVNLIGEHVDYPDVQFGGTPPVHLYSMGGAIQNNYIAAAGRRTDTKVVMAHLQVGEKFTVDLSELTSLESAAVKERESHVPMDQRSAPVWAFHTLGAVQEMANRGVKLGGLNLLLTSNVPHGAGMSNSAANCVALGLVFDALFPELALGETIELVTFARKAENSKFAGGQCGWLDQLLIANSKAGMLTKIDYADNGIEHFESKLPPHMQLVAINTNVPHVLAESDYGHRVLELKLGIEFLSRQLGTNVGGPSLTLGTLNALVLAFDPTAPAVAIPSALSRMEIVTGEAECTLAASKISELVSAVQSSFVVPTQLPLHNGQSPKKSFGMVLRRMRHQKMSSLLVPLAGKAAAQGDSALFGLLLDLEGDSLRMSGDFMITGDNGAQDALLDAGLKSGKALKLAVHGRMLGGGGGGNVLLFADKSKPEQFETWMTKTISVYNSWAESKYPGKGIVATVITPEMAAGARRL